MKKNTAAEKYFALPSRKNPKFWLSADGKSTFKKGLFFYPAFSWKAKMKKWALLNSYPILAWIFSHGKHSIEELMGHPLLSELQTLSRPYGRWANLYVPTPGKIVIQLVRNDARISAYMKIGIQEKERALIKREFQALQWLNNRELSNFEVPRVLEYEEKNGTSSLILSAPPHLFYPENYELEKLLPVVREIYFLKFAVKPLKESGHFQKIKKRAGGEIPEKIEHLLADQPFPSGCLHYDFKPWNIMVNGETGKFFVIDWEFFTQEGLPLWDLFTFVLQPMLLTRGASVDKILVNLRHHFPLMREELSKLDLDEGILPFLFTLYLIDSIAFLENYGHRDKRTNMTLRKLEELLREYEKEIL